MSDFQLVCKLTDIPVLGSRIVKRSGQIDIAIFRNTEDQVFALLDECPHKGGPLSQGIVHGTSVTCPLHAWKIGLVDGVAQTPDIGCVQRFEVKVENGTVFLAL
jgi:nitrite reductase (NADH) small subunit